MRSKEFGEIITKIRYEHNLSAKDFADKYNVTYQTASRWERGLKSIDIETIQKICEDYNLDYESIFNPQKRKLEKRKNIIFTITSILLIILILVLTTIIKPK